VITVLSIDILTDIDSRVNTKTLSISYQNLLIFLSNVEF